MAGVTSPLAFPYPTGTDLVMNGDDAIQALAEKVDDYLTPAVGPAFVALPRVNGWTGSIYYAKWGALVTIVVTVDKASFAGNEIIGQTLPVGYRPVNTVAVAGLDASMSGTFRAFAVHTNGNVATAAAGTGSIWGSATYIIGPSGMAELLT